MINYPMKFLTALREIYPNMPFETMEISGELYFNINHINWLFDSTNLHSAKNIIKIDAKLLEYVPYNIIELELQKSDSLVIRNIKEKMRLLPTITPSSTIILTADVLRNFITNLFPKEIFIYNITIEYKYKVSMFMMKYNICFEFPSDNNDHIVRGDIISKTGMKVITLHDETTFGGNITQALHHLSCATGIVTNIILNHK